MVARQRASVDAGDDADAVEEVWVGIKRHGLSPLAMRAMDDAIRVNQGNLAEIDRTLHLIAVLAHNLSDSVTARRMLAGFPPNGH